MKITNVKRGHTIVTVDFTEDELLAVKRLIGKCSPNDLINKGLTEEQDELLATVYDGLCEYFGEDNYLYIY